MANRHLLALNVLGPNPVLEISQTAYSALADARSVLSKALSIEQKYEILISNYLALERRLLSDSAEAMVMECNNYEEFFDRQMPLTVCIVNLLTAARLYVDQVKQDIRVCTKPSSSDAFERACSAEYDAHFEYRFMEALRNHVQHGGLPIHQTSRNAAWIGDPSEHLEYTIQIYAVRSVLAESPSFKASVLAEMPEQVSLIAASRRYLESLSNIHDVARKTTDPKVDISRRCIEEARAQYSAAGGRQQPGLHAVELADDGQTWLRDVPLLLEWDDIRVRLRARNPMLSNLTKRRVSST